MPDTMNVQMPDGTVIQDVPAGTTQAELGARYAAHVSKLPTVDEVLGPKHPWENDPVVDEKPASDGPHVPLPAGWAPVSYAPPHDNPVMDQFIHRSPIGRILDVFGQGLKDGWGTAPVGLSPETERELRQKGWFNDYNSGRTSLYRSFNEAILRPTAVALDAAARAGNSVLTALGESTGQVMNETGVTKALGNNESQAREEFGEMAQMLPVALGVANEFGAIAKPPAAERPASFAPMAEAPAGATATPAPKVMAASEGIQRPHQLFQDPPPGGPINKAGNINLDYIAAPENVKDVIRQTAQANGGFTDARRGTLSMVETANLADALGMTPESLNARKIGQAFNAEEITAARNLLVQSASNVRDLATQAATGDESAIQAFVEGEAKHKAIQEQVAGLTAEGGRALNAFKIMARQTKDAQSLGDVLNSLGDSVDDAAARAKAIADMDSPDKVSRFLTDSRKPTFKDQFLEYWINGLLSGPATHTTYSMSNALFALWKAGVETPLAAGVGTLRKMFPDADTRQVYLGEAGAELHGIVQGAQEGLIPAREAIKSGIPGALPGEDPWAAKPGAIPGIVGKAIRAPSNVIAGIHTFTRSVGYRQAINKLAYRAAADEGLDGDALTNRIAQLASNPTEEMMATARDEATSQAFMSRSEATMGQLERFANSNILAKMVMPFVRIGSNIINQALVERTPLGLLSQDVRDNLMGVNGAVARDSQIARMAAGTGLGAAVMGLAAKAVITGGGPSDPRENAVWRMTGRQPYSVRIGDTWYAYHRLGSLAMLMGVAADAYDIGHRMTSDESANLASLLTSSISRNILEESWFKGVADLVQATDDPDRYGKRYVNNLAASMIPFSVGMAQVARAIDPDMHSARGLVDTIKSRIPFLSETVAPRYDIWGQPVENQGSLGPDVLSAVYESRVNNDPVNQELNALGIFPGAPQRQIRGAKLDDEQYGEYQRTAGRLAKLQLDQMVNSPGWGALPEFARKEVIENTIRETRSMAAGFMQMRHPELIQQAMQARIKQITGR